MTRPFIRNTGEVRLVWKYMEVKEMVERTTGRNRAFKVVCISCGVKIRENASDDSYGLCLKCFYAMLAARLQAQRVSRGEFVSER